MVTELFDLSNAYFNIRPSNSDQYCGCNCHKYTCTPNPDTYDCEHCYPDRYPATVRVSDAGPAADAPGGEHDLADR